MVHFADYLPHNRKEASTANGMFSGSCSASPVTARLHRLQKARRSKLCNNRGHFDSVINDLHTNGTVSDKQQEKITDMGRTIDYWFNKRDVLAPKGTQCFNLLMFVILNEDRSELKELMWVHSFDFKHKPVAITADVQLQYPYAHVYEIAKCFRWSTRREEFLDTGGR